MADVLVNILNVGTWKWSINRNDRNHHFLQSYGDVTLQFNLQKTTDKEEQISIP